MEYSRRDGYRLTRLIAACALLVLGLSGASSAAPGKGATLLAQGRSAQPKQPETTVEAITEIPRTAPQIRFESWPEPPRPQTSTTATIPDPDAERLRQLRELEMPESVQEKKLYSFRAENLDMKTALALFARANNLNIVPDLDVTGQVTLDVADLSLERMLQALLEAHDYTWTVQEGLIRVHSALPRSYHVDYLRMIRTGTGVSAAMLSSGGGGGAGGAGGGAGGGGGMGGGGGGGGMAGGGGMGGGGGGMGGGGGGANGSAVNLTLENPVDFWEELQEELDKLVTERGRPTLAINRTAGVIEVTDRPSALKRIERYLNSLNTSIHRQVEIEAKLYDVTLNDNFQFGIQWVRVAEVFGGSMTFAGDPRVVNPGGGVPVLTGGFNNMIRFQDDKTDVIIRALKDQGDVSVISQPRLRVLNNQTALIKVGTDTPFFSQNVFFIPSGTLGTTTTTIEQDTYQLITIGTILSITPQISSNNMITLDVSPVITSLVAERTGPNGTTAPELDIKQASSLVRLHDGETVILGGLIQNSASRSTRKIPLIGDIPYLGQLFTGRVHAKQKKELVIFLTPRIVH